jgi:hypothetical protein
MEDCITNNRCIIILVMLRKSKKHMVFCNVYAASVETERRQLWDFILSSMQSLTAPWCVRGDFNLVLGPSKSVSGL